MDSLTSVEPQLAAPIQAPLGLFAEVPRPRGIGM